MKFILNVKYLNFKKEEFIFHNFTEANKKYSELVDDINVLECTFQELQNIRIYKK